jgi:glycosyltransferase involved in cell wall biosynthesis
MAVHSTPKVLHCVERMHTNAIESWLARMHHHALARDRSSVNWWFHVQDVKPGKLETTYPECAARVIRSSCTLSNGKKFFWEFFRLCQQRRFDVVHIHADLMSAPYLVAARLAGTPRAIVHIHNADESLPTSSRLKCAMLKEPFRRIGLTADRVVGISNHTLDTFLHGRPRRASRDVIHYYGVDTARSIEASRLTDGRAVRVSLNLPDEALILLFAGRLAPEKNPLMAVHVLAALRRREPRAYGLFAGAGALENAVLQRASDLGIAEAVRMLGWRDDLPAIMAASDWFVLPRPEYPMEGFGLAVVEAQLAGLRLLLSRGVPADPILPSARMRQLSLAAGADAWAQAALALMKEPAPSRESALAELRASPMDMDFALAGLMDLHV